MFDLLVDVYAITETTVNGEPRLVAADTPLHADVPARFARFSGNTRYLAAGVGIALDARLAMEFRTGVTERSEIRNLRTREGTTVADQPAAYRVVFANPGRRGQHLELDLEALRP